MGIYIHNHYINCLVALSVSTYQLSSIMSNKPYIPTAEEIQDEAIEAISVGSSPTGMPSLLKKIKDNNPTWGLGMQRLKNVMKDYGKMGTDSLPSPLSDPAPRLSALQEQLQYQEKSIRHYRIIGSDGYDYGVTFNASMSIIFSVRFTL